MGISSDNTSYSNDQGLVADLIGIDGSQSALSVSTTAVEAKVGATPLSGRKLLTVFNDGPLTMYWGYKNTVTVNNGTPIFKSQLATWDISEGLSIWLICASGTNTARITEAS